MDPALVIRSTPLNFSMCLPLRERIVRCDALDDNNFEHVMQGGEGRNSHGTCDPGAHIFNTRTCPVVAPRPLRIVTGAFRRFMPEMETTARPSWRFTLGRVRGA